MNTESYGVWLIRILTQADEAAERVTSVLNGSSHGDVSELELVRQWLNELAQDLAIRARWYEYRKRSKGRPQAFSPEPAALSPMARRDRERDNRIVESVSGRLVGDAPAGRSEGCDGSPDHS